MASRLLDIVVTHYNEPWEIVRPFFDILNAQRCVDMSLFKIWFVQDGPSVDIFPKGYFDGSKLDVEWVTIPHTGVSAARNAGMDKADSEWICFCDCDDCFTGIFCLKMLAYILKPDQPYDLMWNPFCMNVMAMDDVVIMQDVYNRIWIHNKYYRLSFLRENNLRFPEWIHFSEDSAFNNILDLDGLAMQRTVRVLDVRDNFIRDISVILLMRSLETVYVDGNPILDYRPLDMFETAQKNRQ